MSLLNFFKKKKKKDNEIASDLGKSEVDYKQMAKDVDKSQLSFKERASLKMFEKMPKKKQEKILRQAMNPQEMQKHKDKVLKQIDDMIKSGQIDKGQAEAVRSKMGLR